MALEKARKKKKTLFCTKQLIICFLEKRINLFPEMQKVKAYSAQVLGIQKTDYATFWEVRCLDGISSISIFFIILNNSPDRLSNL